MPPNSRMAAIQREAWAFGRRLRVSTLEEYEREYGERAPPPALIGPELLQDFLGAKVVYDPLPLDIFAQTTIHDGAPLVTINSLTSRIDGVQDAGGVQNVGVWHEAVHVERDLHLVRVGPQGVLPGLLVNLTIACHRDTVVPYPARGAMHEYFAEEAGRAAAVSYPHLLVAEPFRRFIELSRRRILSNSSAWSLLYSAAEEIGVNPSALVKQLREEGFIAVERVGGRSLIYSRPTLGHEMAVSG